MRALLVAVAMLASIPARAAESTEQRIVEFIKEACVRPDSPSAKLAAAERIAASQGWKFDEARSGRRPFEFRGDALISVVRLWEMPAPTFKRAHVLSSAVESETAGVTMNICKATIPGPKFVDEELAREVEEQLSAETFEWKPQVKSNVTHLWLFLESGKPPRSCNRKLLVMHGPSSTTIELLKASSESGSKWERLTAGAGKCPQQ